MTGKQASDLGNTRGGWPSVSLALNKPLNTLFPSCVCVCVDTICFLTFVHLLLCVYAHVSMCTMCTLWVLLVGGWDFCCWTSLKTKLKTETLTTLCLSFINTNYVRSKMCAFAWWVKVNYFPDLFSHSCSREATEGQSWIDRWMERSASFVHVYLMDTWLHYPLNCSLKSDYVTLFY